MWWKKDPTATYFQSLNVRTDPQRFAEIAKAIAKQGFWEERVEWRISIERTSRIERADVGGVPAFRVTVKCDHEFRCHCPTLERAVYFEAVYVRLISDLFYQLGWPSWADRRRLEPVDGETRPP